VSVLIFASGAVFALLLPRQWQWQWQWQWQGDWRLPGGRRKTLVVFGDSLTQHGYRLDTAGWVAGLSDVLVRRVDVLNRGIRELVAVAKRHSLRVALITPPPIELEALKKRNAERGKAILADRNNEETRQYAQAVILEGASLKVPVLDIFSPMLATDRGPGALLLDGLHFNELGNQQLLALVRDGLLKTHFPDLLAGELDFQNTS
jgi:lysophospholipase L1-like esterase